MFAKASHISPTPISPTPARGCFDGPVHRYALDVFYEDTDAGGVVYHANYLKWFERARTDILRLLGIDQRTARDAGEGTYVVVEANVKYVAPARLGDVVTIETLCEEARASSVRLSQTAWRESDRLVDAAIRVGFVGPEGRPRRQPEPWRAAFASFISSSQS